jgi:uncharacterized protein (DUF2141 family)
MAALGLGLVMASTQSIAMSGVLRINVENVKNDEGVVRVLLYDSEDTFLKTHALEASAPAVEGATQIVFMGLEAGKYAAVAFHDDDSNGKIDRNFLGIPVDGFGFSGEAGGKLKRPDHEEAAIDVTQDQINDESVRLRYL